jgi:hypothetical protein
MGDIFEVWWRGVLIGIFEVIAVDMWYQDGIFRPNTTPDAGKFKTMITSFKASTVIKDPTKGTCIILRSIDSGSELNALVLCFVDTTLSIRLVVDKEAIQWLIKNVH